jgi:hypothetical protein
MIRRVAAICVLTAASAVMIAAAAERATFVLTNGQHVSGELTYKGGTVYTLDGKDYPSDDVAVIDFVGGEPPASELQQLPASVTQEHERDMFVMRDGNVVKGKLYHIAPDGSSISFDPLGGSSAADRRTVPSSQIARIYINAPKARAVYASALNAPPPATVATTGTGGSITVQGNQPWTDTGITVRRGDWVSFSASGQIQVTGGEGADRVATPDGSASWSGPRTNYPIPAMAVGGLIGKVGNSAPFPVGSKTQPIQMPAAGRLYLGINDDHLPDNSGSFTVVVKK